MYISLFYISCFFYCRFRNRYLLLRELLPSFYCWGYCIPAGSLFLGIWHLTFVTWDLGWCDILLRGWELNWQEREGGGCGGVGGRKEGKRGMCVYDHHHHMKDGRRAGGVGCADYVGVNDISSSRSELLISSVFFVIAVRISLSLLINLGPKLAGGLHFHPDDEIRYLG